MKGWGPAVLIAAAAGMAGPAFAAGDAVAGRIKSAVCVVCHGAHGEGTQMGPRLAGLDPATFVRAMNGYASGRKDNAMMQVQASTLNAADVADLAAYYAALK